MAPRREEVVFASPTVRVGRFRATPDDPSFSAGYTSGHLLVFPRTTVRITHAGADPVVADPTRIMFYNRHQEYRRDAISARGDLCEWFAIAPEALVEAEAAHDPRAVDRRDRPFAYTNGPSDPTTYVLQRALYDHVAGGAPHDPIFVEEAALTILRRAVANVHGSRTVRPPASTRAKTRRGHAELVDFVKVHLASRFDEAVSLADVARAVGSSPFHLCRVFRALTGLTVHGYLDSLRVHAALERIVDGAADLTRVGLDLGYSSHSHFTRAFRETFGMTPSEVRRIRRAPNATLRKILTGVTAGQTRVDRFETGASNCGR